MPTDADRLKAILAASSALGIGLRPRRYDGDVADLIAEGRTDFAPAVAITIYFDALRERFAEGVVACWEEFDQRFDGQLTWYADEELGKWRTASADRLRRPTRRLGSSGPMPFYAWTSVSGERFESASAVTFTATVRESAGGHLSFIRATFPTALTTEAAVEEFVIVARRWCERVPTLHGYGGLTVNQSPHEPQVNSGMLLQIAERFHGFEIDDCGGTVLVARDFIKSTNWLTFLGRPFIDRLGGVVELRSGLSPAIDLLPLKSGGAIVWAGRLPVRGDIHKDDDLESYREVARRLRPVCLDAHPPLGPAEVGSFGSEKTRLWLGRLDT